LTIGGLETTRIAELLRPFAGDRLPHELLRRLSDYLELLLRWNARVNLTAVREPEQIVTRHFGESLFAARALYPSAATDGTLVDIGSGAGFPGIPITLWAAEVDLTLVESKQKKVTFLREALRTLDLKNAQVFAGRAEDFVGPSAGSLTVTLRAVECFEQILPTAARLVGKGARLALLIGEAQVTRAHQILPEFSWREAVAIPQSERRVLLVGERAGK